PAQASATTTTSNRRRTTTLHLTLARTSLLAGHQSVERRVAREVQTDAVRHDRAVLPVGEAPGEPAGRRVDGERAAGGRIRLVRRAGAAAREVDEAAERRRRAGDRARRRR